ncbi:MAG: phosphatidate cytidylyltransferase [Gammaproteobacteria bacterium CG11_big_fil_rev_8_21_14_0_20_46_22]|nr:MAG: phosphatidate cytidylyltransferase [Gammaproteobacteria bacterium CG12_big_fil_rev_8_21_14_0_65_46_12]PIR11369.1 MAG: phosphatidate cytidylyltransferase [Gammaproteobacteria bacterium CG11_big_fil_rev_8_21_14_0_20_46_22]
MLKQRVITGLIMAFAALAAVFFASTMLFAYLSAIVFLCGAWEWSRLSGLGQAWQSLLYTALMALVLLGVWYTPLLLVMAAACVFWLFAMYCIVKYPKHTQYWSPAIVRQVIGFFVLAPSWLAINVIRESEQGAWVLLSLFVIVWAADIGAYFAGRAWGRRALMPNVSPKKTFEGFLGGLVLSLLLAAVIIALLPDISLLEWFELLLGVVLVNIYSVAGDLFESVLKRYCGVKDSGKMLPGHGGVLDRIDSLTAAAPLFLLGLMLIWFW